MSPRRRPRWSRVPLYNPALLPPEDLEALFAAHQRLLDRLAEDLRRASHQHHLIVGGTGTGKTMLLQRLRLAILEDEALAATHLPIALPDDLWEVAGTGDLWRRALETLRYQRPKEVPTHTAPDQPLAELLGVAQDTGRRIVLLLDDLDRLLDRLQDQQWEVREVLSARVDLLLVGTSVTPIASTYDYGAAFYDFFHVHELRELDEDTALDVLDRLGTPNLDDARPTVRALLALSGGRVRAVMMLRRVLGDRRRWSPQELLEHVLDETTPAHRARMDGLPAQAQRVLAHLALAWHPLSASEVAERAGLPTNQTSAQLGRLVAQDLVEKVPYPPSSRLGFQLSDRFFNAWILMRRGGAARDRLERFIELAAAGEPDPGADAERRARAQALRALAPDGGALPPERSAPELRRLLAAVTS